jgi:hypothetical protein
MTATLGPVLSYLFFLTLFALTPIMLVSWGRLLLEDRKRRGFSWWCAVVVYLILIVEMILILVGLYSRLPPA